jgi:hypothetical protein
MYKTIFLQITFFILCLTPSIAPLPANAMTAEEFLKLMGVLGRYSDDLNRTFRPNNQPNDSPQPDPNSHSTQQDSNPTTDGSIEQFFPRQ